MLQHLDSFLDLDEELLSGDGLWSREQLEEMNCRFVAAMELAFAKGLESRAAAAATYAVNGKQRADEITVELAWRWFVAANFDVPAAVILARCPGVAPERVREGIKRRFALTVRRARNSGAANAAPDRVTGKDGKSYPAKRPKPKSEPKCAGRRGQSMPQLERAKRSCGRAREASARGGVGVAPRPTGQGLCDPSPEFVLGRGRVGLIPERAEAALGKVCGQ
jgi:hypothetical protein